MSKNTRISVSAGGSGQGYGGRGGASFSSTPDPANNDRRLEAWATAESLVRSIVEQHGLEAYKDGAVLSQFNNTKAEQHLRLIIQTADWLLDH